VNASYGPWGTLYFYSITGQRLATYHLYYVTGTPTTLTTSMYFGGRLLAPVDRLGSVRGNANGSIAYFPWGEEEKQSTGYTTPDGTDKYATYFRDGTTNGAGQDYANARYYNNNFGRFWSPDPAGTSAVDYKNPTSWNGYIYVWADPINAADPSGRCVIAGVTYPDGQPPCPDVTGVNVVGYGNSTAYGPWNGMDGYESGFHAIQETSGPGGGASADPNKVRDCAAAPASALQYAEAAGVTALTAEFFTGLGPSDYLFGPDSPMSQVMAQSAGVQQVLNDYYMLGQTSGLYVFGAQGLAAAGVNPVAQFVGSFTWTITPTGGGILLSLSNTTSFTSLTYDKGPQWERRPKRLPTPMGNTRQTYDIVAPCK
jgi:RHS repeat-associated protein